MHLLSWLVALNTIFLTIAAQSGSTYTPARPPSFPLAVKSPYLSAWLPAGGSGGNKGYLPGIWPTSWTGQYLGWTGLVRVDGKTFTWMGAPLHIPTAKQTAAEYTSTRSIFTITADDKVQVKVTFLSPITPKDFKRQSLIFSYMDVEVSSLDNSNHDVQIYTDISAEWVSGKTSTKAEWSFGTTSNGIHYHKVSRQQQLLFSEIDDRAEWGNHYYATNSGDGVTYQSGVDNDVRGTFNQTGKLGGSEDTKFRAVDDSWPVLGYAIDLGSVGPKAKSSLFSIGHCQDDAIQYLGNSLPSLWKSYFEDDLAALSYFHRDYDTSSKLSTTLDNKINEDSKKVAGDKYAILTTLAARQAFGATQLVGTNQTKYLFLKEISSNGNTQTVDVIFPSAPIFLYMNPELLKLLIAPHLDYQEGGSYPNLSAIHDLGTHYPNATGHDDGQDESMPIEECGNQLIMMLAYIQRTGDQSYAKNHYKLISQWAQFLVDGSLYPAVQLSTDDFAGHLANQTNLALKGIIGLKAASQLATSAGNKTDADKWGSTADTYIKKWQELGINKADKTPHAILTYNNVSTHGLLYNLYSDRLLNLKFVPQEVYDIQSKFYPTIKGKYGVPLDTRNAYTKSDWEMFCAAIASTETRDMFINSLAKWVAETPTSRPFADIYMVESGDFPGGIEFTARPVQGGLYALLVLPDENKGYSPPNFL